MKKKPKNVEREPAPKLSWLGKHDDKTVGVDIYPLYRHEHISPEILLNRFYHLREVSLPQWSINDLFDNALEKAELEKASMYYQHQDDWKNRMIQGDSLLVMTSLLEREGMAGSVQMIYIAPPYGIQFKGHWHKQISAYSEKRNYDSDSEPEKINAYCDTWQFGINSYLSHLLDRLIKAKELLTSSGACFVQISDENMHFVRFIMDEVFGRENFVATIILKTRSSSRHKRMSILNDYIIFYAKDIKQLKYHKLYTDKPLDLKRFRFVELDNGEVVKINKLERIDKSLRPFASEKLESTSGAGNTILPFKYKGIVFKPQLYRGWRCSASNLEKLAQENRLIIRGNNLRYKYYFDDFPAVEISNLWVEQLSAKNKTYVVQTSVTVIQRCLLMTTDPGDLVLDPTCGSGTTAIVAEQWGRRWITIDTSRIALNIAKKRLMTAMFPYYQLLDETGNDIRKGFIYKKLPHTTMRTVIYDESPIIETLYDKPQENQEKFRVAGPFVIETLHKPVIPKYEVERAKEDLEQRIFEHLKFAGVKNGRKNESAIFIQVEHFSNGHALHAEGLYNSLQSQKKAYFHIGPQFGTVSKQAVNSAIKECRRQHDANWLIILGFSFEDTISNANVTTSLGHFEVTKVRMHDDLLQPGLLKKDKQATSFVTIGEANIQLHHKTMQVEIFGFDIYNPIKNQVETRDVHDIAYWMVDENYGGSNFVPTQVFFCGGNKSEFKKWRERLNLFAKQASHATLKIEIDEEAFARVYGHISHPITIKHTGQKIAVRVISQFGEESTKILENAF